MTSSHANHSGLPANPVLLHKTLHRSRVAGAIERGLAAGICWLAAPAGYGKTTAVTDYLGRNGLASLWIRIEASDGDLAKFFSHLAGCLTDAQRLDLPQVQAPDLAQVEVFAQRFFGAFFAQLHSLVVVFDNLHRVTSPRFQAVIAVMLKALPEVGHCICIDRAAPVADDLVANSRLHIIAPQVLEFTPREARQLIVRRLHYAASYLDLAAAQGRAADLATYAHQVAVTAAQALADDAAFDRNSYESAAGVEPPLVKISVLAAFRVEVDGRELELGAKAPIKSLDILRALAIAPTRSCALADLYEWFWPDADGDLAKAACDQALHRLRKLLGNAAQVTQRNGRVHLRGDNLCIDLDEWEVALQAGLRPLSEQQESERGMEDAFRSFPGPLVECDRSTPWMQSAAERVRGKFIELTARLARAYEGRGAHARARALYLRAIDMYPTCSRCYESLIRGSLAQGDVPRAIEDYRRYERMLRASGIQPAVAIQSAIKQAMHAPLRVESTHQAFALA